MRNAATGRPRWPGGGALSPRSRPPMVRAGRLGLGPSPSSLSPGVSSVLCRGCPPARKVLRSVAPAFCPVLPLPCHGRVALQASCSVCRHLLLLIHNFPLSKGQEHSKVRTNSKIRAGSYARGSEEPSCEILIFQDVTGFHAEVFQSQTIKMKNVFIFAAPHPHSGVQDIEWEAPPNPTSPHLRPAPAAVPHCVNSPSLASLWAGIELPRAPLGPCPPCIFSPEWLALASRTLGLLILKAAAPRHGPQHPPPE